MTIERNCISVYPFAFLYAVVKEQLGGALWLSPGHRPLTMRAFRRFLRQLSYRKLFAFVKHQGQITLIKS